MRDGRELLFKPWKNVWSLQREKNGLLDPLSEQLYGGHSKYFGGFWTGVSCSAQARLHCLLDGFEVQLEALMGPRGAVYHVQMGCI